MTAADAIEDEEIRPVGRGRVHVRSVAGALAGNLIEGYDWLTWSTFALYFAPVFFPSGDRTAQLLNAAAVFAVGYIMRPLGAILLGWLSDRKGRRVTLSVSVLAMGFGSLMIAVMPGPAVIGLAAPVLLIVARVIQGMSMGGEYGASAALLIELAPPHRRGFIGSFHYVTLVGGQLLTIAVLLVLQHLVLTPAQLASWGWRIPFAIGAALSLVGLWLRRGIVESLEVQKVARKVENPLLVFIRHPRPIIQVAGITIGGTIATHVYTTYMLKFLVNSIGLSAVEATVLTASALLIFMAMQPLTGALSDWVGRKPVLITFGLCGTLFTVPLLRAMTATSSRPLLFGLLLAGLAMTSLFTGLSAVVKAEMFPPHIRSLGIGVPHAIVLALIGGTAEFVALAFKHAGNEQGFFYYCAAWMFVALLFYLTMPETRRKNE